MRPEDESLLQKEKASLHYFFVIFVIAIVKSYLYEKVEADLCCSIVQTFLKNSDFLIWWSVKQFCFCLLELPFDIDEAHIGGYFLDERVRGGRIVRNHEPLHGVDHLGLEFASKYQQYYYLNLWNMKWFFTTISQNLTNLLGSLFSSWTAFSDQSIQLV